MILNFQLLHLESVWAPVNSIIRLAIKEMLFFKDVASYDYTAGAVFDQLPHRLLCSVVGPIPI